MFSSAHEVIIACFNRLEPTVKSLDIDSLPNQKPTTSNIPPRSEKHLEAHLIIQSLNLAEYETEFLKMYAEDKLGWFEISLELEKKFKRKFHPATLSHMLRRLLVRIENRLKSQGLMEE